MDFSAGQASFNHTMKTGNCPENRRSGTLVSKTLTVPAAADGAIYCRQAP
jgi:hypothetical protein